MYIAGDIFGPSGDGGEKPSPDKDNEPRETDNTVLSKKGKILRAL